MKDAYYFSHDGNARNDPKMLMLRGKYKNNGYACYFMILEMMRESHNYKLPNNEYLIASISLALSEQEDYIKDLFCFMFAIDLLQQDENWVWSESFLRRMERKENMSRSRSDAGRLGGLASWENRSKTEAKLKQNRSKVEAVKESKGKESKENTTISATAEEKVSGRPVNWENCKTPLQKVVATYVKLTTPALYACCTQEQATAIFKVQGKAVGPLLAQCGDVSTACHVVELAARYYTSKGLDWSLHAVNKSCIDYLNQIAKERNYGTSEQHTR